jgi:hypothetical protein
MLAIKLTKSILKTTDKYIEALEKAWVKTVGDSLYHFVLINSAIAYGILYFRYLG